MSWFSLMLYERYAGWRDAIGAIFSSHNDAGDWTIIVSMSCLCIAVWYNFFTNHLRSINGPWQLPFIGNLYPYLADYDKFQEYMLTWDHVFGPFWTVRLPIGAGKGDGTVKVISALPDIRHVLQGSKSKGQFTTCHDFDVLMDEMFGVLHPFRSLKSHVSGLATTASFHDYVHQCALHASTSLISDSNTIINLDTNISVLASSMALDTMIQLWVGEVSWTGEEYTQFHETVYALQSDVLDRLTTGGTRHKETMNSLLDQCQVLLSRAGDRLTKTTGATPTYLANTLRRGGADQVDIRRACALSIFLGTHMIANSISWCLYLLATHRDEQETARREAPTLTVPSPPAQCSGDKGDKDPASYLLQCARETERMYPPIPHIFRIVTQDTTLPSDCKVSGGDTIVCSLLCAGRSRRNFLGPTIFDPDRWSRAEVEESSLDDISLFCSDDDDDGGDGGDIVVDLMIPSRAHIRRAVATCVAVFLSHTRSVPNVEVPLALGDIHTNITTTPDPQLHLAFEKL